MTSEMVHLAITAGASEAYLTVDRGGQPIHLENRLIQSYGWPGEYPEFNATEAIGEALARLPTGLISNDSGIYVWISSADFSEWNGATYSSAMRKAITLYPEVQAVGAANDVTSLLLGSNVDVAVIAGTGSAVAMAADKTSGTIRRLGGREWLATDEGAAFWIGQRAIRKTMQYIQFLLNVEEQDRFDKVQKLVLRHFHCEEDVEVFDEKVRNIARNFNKRKVADVASQICSGADEGDPGCCEIVNESASLLAILTKRGLQSGELTETTARLQVALCGKMFKCNQYRKSYAAALDVESVEWVDSDGRYDGCAAAVEMCRRLAADAPQLWVDVGGVARDFRAVDTRNLGPVIEVRPADTTRVDD